MRCPSCNTENAPGAKFCAKCGTRLPESAPAAAPEAVRFCAGCGQPIPAGAKFCKTCGHPVNNPAAPAATDTAASGSAASGGLFAAADPAPKADTPTQQTADRFTPKAAEPVVEETPVFEKTPAPEPEPVKAPEPEKVPEPVKAPEPAMGAESQKRNDKYARAAAAFSEEAPKPEEAKAEPVSTPVSAPKDRYAKATLIDADEPVFTASKDMSKQEFTKQDKAPEQAAAPVMEKAATGPVCPKCGAPLNPKFKFCKECGTPIDLASTTEPPRKESAKRVKNSLAGDGDTFTKEQKPSKGSSTGMILGIIAGVALLALVAVLLFLKPWQSKSASDEPQVAEGTQDAAAQDNETVRSEPAPAPTPSKKEYSEADLAQLFAEGDSLAADGDANVVAGQYMDAYVSYGDAMKAYAAPIESDPDLLYEANEKVLPVYYKYLDSVTKYNQFLFDQYLDGGLYVQARNTLDDALTLSSDLSSKGFSVDPSSLQEQRDSLREIFRQKYLAAFNEFTTRENWSRDEAWALMQNAYGPTEANGSHSLFELSDLDDPLVRRYHYAYAYATRKSAEKNLAEGLIDYAEAAEQLKSILPACDYNPLVMYDVLRYAEAAGSDQSSVAAAFSAMLSQLSSTQGITITDNGTNSGSSIDINHFWYFNDFASGLSDSYNGVTADNMQWIRNNMPAYLQ